MRLRELIADGLDGLVPLPAAVVVALRRRARTAAACCEARQRVGDAHAEGDYSDRFASVNSPGVFGTGVDCSYDSPFKEVDVGKYGSLGGSKEGKNRSDRSLIVECRNGGKEVMGRTFSDVGTSGVGCDFGDLNVVFGR